MPSKQVSKNRYKPRTKRSAAGAGQRWESVIRLFGFAFFVVGLSLMLVLVHDVATQSAYFGAIAIDVAGNRRLSDRQILDQARIQTGGNILAVNLGVVRKRLLAHPWIAQAQIGRNIPDRIEIRIQEHRAAAIVDMGRRYLIDSQGVVFKAHSDRDPLSLPRVSGLRYADLKLDSQTVENKRGAEPEGGPSPLLVAVKTVLDLAGDPDSAVPLQAIDRIHVDPQLGLTLFAFDPVKTIKLGFGNYRVKYTKLRQVITMLRQNGIQDIRDFETVDLIDPERIVMQPVRKSAASGI